jgi:hypothetical protein
MVFTSQTDRFLLTIAASDPDRVPNQDEIKYALKCYVPKGMAVKQVFLPNVHKNCVQFIEERETQ